MHISLSFDAFVTLPYTTGVVQNINDKATVEIRPEYIDNGGLILKPGEKYRFNNSTIYAKSLWKIDKPVKVAVVPATYGGGGGGGGGDISEAIATDEEVDEMMDSIFD